MRPTSLKVPRVPDGKGGCVELSPQSVAIRTLEEGPTPSRVLQAYCGLLGSKVRAPPPCCRPPLLGDRRARRSGRHFPASLQGASPPWPSCLQLRGPGAAAQPRDAPRRPGQCADNDPFSPRRLLLPTPPPSQPPDKPISHSGRQNPAAPRIVPRSARPPSLALITLSRLTAPRAARRTPHSPPAPGPASQ